MARVASSKILGLDTRTYGRLHTLIHIIMKALSTLMILLEVTWEPLLPLQYRASLSGFKNEEK